MNTTLASSETECLARSSNALGFELWARRRTSGNFAISPTSISMALAMTCGGAKGETAAQMKKVLHTDMESDALMTSWGKLSRALAEPSRPMKLRIANRLFGEKSASFERSYLDQTRAAFGAPLEPLDFKSAPEPSRVHVNAWVEEQTEKRIKDLLPAASIDEDTRLLLVNALYLLGSWQSPFDAANTVDEPFAMTPTTKKRVPTMHQVTRVRIARTSGLNLLELPYKGDAASLLIALPDRVDGLAAVEAGLSNATFTRWKRELSMENVHIALPRFEVNPIETASLTDDLAALGMPLAFDPHRADFTKMANPPNPDERLYIDDVFHKSFVKVDEKGTEAAAATAVEMAAVGGLPPKPVEFTADHPFLFFIVDKASGLLLFMGRVTEP